MEAGWGLAALLLSVGLLSSVAAVGDVEVAGGDDACDMAGLDMSSLRGVCDLNSPLLDLEACCFHVDWLYIGAVGGDKCFDRYLNKLRRAGYAHIAWHYGAICGQTVRRGLAADAVVLSNNSPLPVDDELVKLQSSTSTPNNNGVLSTSDGATDEVARSSQAPVSEDGAMSIGVPLLLQFMIAVVVAVFLR